jgi:hypothetical protein
VLQIRACDQCGTGFEPQREHARFCSAGCRVAWNRQQAGGEHPGESALAWSVTAMTETTRRLARLRVTDLPQAFAAVSETVWRITIVDATLVRYHPSSYSQALTAQLPAQRLLIESTFTGLRFVRNQMGYHTAPSQFIQPRDVAGDHGPVTDWTWKPLAPPALAGLPPHRAEWEAGRYHAYQDHLADQAIGSTFKRATAFLTQAATAASDSDDQSSIAR